MEARTPTWTYRTGRLLRRHRWAATAAALAVFSVSGSTVHSIWQARVAERERAKAVQVAMLLEHLVVNAYAGTCGAEAEARETMNLVRQVFPAGHIEIARAQATLARVLLVTGKPAEAITLLREALPVARKVYPKDNWRTAETQMLLGAALAISGPPGGGREEMEAGLREMRAVLPDHHPRVQEALRIHTRCQQPKLLACTQP